MADGANPEIKFKHVFTKENPGAIADYYKMDRKMLGEGSYGQVVKGEDKSTKNIRAIKAIDISKISDRDRFDQEVAIQQSLDHPHIVKLYEVFKDAKRMYLVMELCTGGELFDRILEEAERQEQEGHEGQAFDERGAANYMKQILGGMRYLHAKNYVHRDIKPENFLLQDKTKDAAIKIIDFGLATSFTPGKSEPMKTKAGTPYYVAPEVLKGAYDEKCDIWSCGVICYVLLCGYPPFYGDRDEDILRQVKKGEFDFPSPDWDNISDEGKKIIKKMLTLDPKKRPSAFELLDDEKAHPWLSAHADKPKGNIGKDLGAKLRSFSGVGKLKKVAMTMIAQQMSDKDVSELKQTFALLDKNNDGTLTYKEIFDGFKQHKIAMSEDLEATINALDTDGSGTIDYTEFIAAGMTTKQYMKKEVIWSAFRTFDSDGDGKITKDELRQVLKSEDLSENDLTKQVNEMMDECDLDGDGTISWDEFQAMMDKPSSVTAL